MNNPKGICCLCLNVSLKEPLIFLLEKADDDLTHFDRICSSLSQLANVLSDLGCSNYKLCKKCCDNIEMIYKFNNSCLKNVKKYPSLKQKLNTRVEGAPPVEVEEEEEEEEVFIEVEHFLDSSNNDEDEVLKKDVEDVDGVMDICQVDMVIENPEKIQQECFSGVFDAFLEKQQTIKQNIKDRGNFLEQSTENYVENVAIQTNFKSELENKGDIDIEQVLGGHVIIASANDEQPLEEAQVSTQNHSKNSQKKGKRFTCKYCNKNFDFKSTLHIHMLTHKSQNNSKKPYVCDICKKSYKTKVSFETHKLLHTGQNPYSCDFCNRQFRTKYILDKHKQTHMGEEPYECDFCNKVFGTRNQLMDHRTVHTGD